MIHFRRLGFLAFVVVLFAAPRATRAAIKEKVQLITLANTAPGGFLTHPGAAVLPNVLAHPVAASLPPVEDPIQGPAVFPIYAEGLPFMGFFIPSGLMGDVRDLQIDPASRISPAVGKTCMKISYSAEGSYEYQYVGMFWQSPPSGIGLASDIHNFSDMHRLTFWARGAEGGEVIDFFKVGATGGHFHDSGAAQIGPITLTRQWKKYTIDVSGIDRHRITHPFGWMAGFFDNPHGMTFFLNEIKFER